MNNRTFMRRMYANDSEVGRMKLQSVKENLYEATTKVVLYSIEMYTKKDLSEWARTDLIGKLHKANGDLKRAQDELEQGHIGMFDITNGCSCINDFVRKDALTLSRNELNLKLEKQKSKEAELTEELELLKARKAALESDETGDESDSDCNAEGSDTTDKIEDFFDDDSDDANVSGPEYDAADENDGTDEDDEFLEDADQAGDVVSSGTKVSAKSGIAWDIKSGESENSISGYGADIDDDTDDEDDDIDVDDDEETDGSDVDGRTAAGQKSAKLSETEALRKRIAACKDPEEIDTLIDEHTEKIEAVKAVISELNELTRGGKNLLAKLDDEEKTNLESLRVIRNTGYAHKTEDEVDISLIGTWEPEAGPLYEWAKAILSYIGVIEKRYRICALFDEYYAAREGKDKFDSCKVYVQRQIKELYVNHSNVVLEFAGELYDKEDDEYNFPRLIENMAVSWDTGIRYLTIVTNDDLPELNVFFKECLSGTRKYVDSYLMDRNELRAAVRKKDKGDADYIYFKLLYHLNPAMDKIYWKGREFTRETFAGQIIYKIIKVKNMFQLDGRLAGFEKYLDGIDVIRWSEHRLLSEVYFAAHDDVKGAKLARAVEDALIDFAAAKGKGRNRIYKILIKASVYLYFYMTGNYVFSYTGENGRTVHWSSLDDACRYMENDRVFKSYAELSGFVDELYKSDYFKIWRRNMQKQLKKSEVR